MYKNIFFYKKILKILKIQSNFSSSPKTYIFLANKGFAPPPA